MTCVGAAGFEPTLVRPGDVVDGYKIGKLVAKEGGMGLLYLVEDPGLPRLPLVMKVLSVDRSPEPGNLFLHHEAELGEVIKLIDFGISHLGMGPAITALNATSGTRRYMAPEQARGQDDERADQFSLAAVLFQMLTGQLPWPNPKKDDGGAHERLVAQGRFHRLRALLPDAPGELDTTITRALSPNPDDRFASVFEFGRRLLPLASPEARALFQRYADKADSAQPSVVFMPWGSRGYSNPALADALGTSEAGRKRLHQPGRRERRGRWRSRNSTPTPQWAAWRTEMPAAIGWARSSKTLAGPLRSNLPRHAGCRRAQSRSVREHRYVAGGRRCAPPRHGDSRVGRSCALRSFA